MSQSASAGLWVVVAGGACARRGAAGAGVKGQTPGVTRAGPGAFAPRGADAVLGGWDSPRETLAAPVTREVRDHTGGDVTQAAGGIPPRARASNRHVDPRRPTRCDMALTAPSKTLSALAARDVPRPAPRPGGGGWQRAGGPSHRVQ